MKAALLIALCLGAAVAMTDVEKWTSFKNTHSRKFIGMGEENLRFQVFRANLRAAELLQSQDDHAEYGVTKFMDMTPEEFQTQYMGLNATAFRNWRKALPVAEAGVGAPVVDWVNGPTKAVSAVKDQGNCGSCWAFSAAAGLEGCAMLANGGSNVDVSAQQIVDCCSAGGSDGCNGGWEDQALSWAVGKDMATWASYSYTAKKSTCKAVTSVAVKANACKFVQNSGTETNLQSMLGNGPVSIALAANNLQYYTSGIMSGTTCKDSQVNHAVLLTANTGTAYTVKNSWGASWGEKGFFRMATGVNCLHVGDENAQALPK